MESKSGRHSIPMEGLGAGFSCPPGVPELAENWGSPKKYEIRALIVRVVDVDNR
jgi:hypothetical protein